MKTRLTLPFTPAASTFPDADELAVLRACYLRQEPVLEWGTPPRKPALPPGMSRGTSADG